MLNLLGVILIIAAIFVGVRGQAAAAGPVGWLGATVGGLALAIPGVGLALFG
ncbi:hypothetical protein [Xanthomonas sp. NCPPB 2632]|uniref:hypothetical protein n=1 Tax=Xanthomonas sp. NCPPB 2632 TaxID=3240912 RepID=UPI003514718F